VGPVRGVLVSLVFTGAPATLILGTEEFVPQSLQVIVLPLGIAAILVVQSFRISAMVKRTYRRHGWNVRRED
jgi:hypothetical protein